LSFIYISPAAAAATATVTNFVVNVVIMSTDKEFRIVPLEECELENMEVPDEDSAHDEGFVGYC
jgi:hypothetical protein